MELYEQARKCLYGSCVLILSMKAQMINFAHLECSCKDIVRCAETVIIMIDIMKHRQIKSYIYIKKIFYSSTVM